MNADFGALTVHFLASRSQAENGSWMDLMHEHTMDGVPVHMLLIWLALGLATVLLAWFVLLMTRRASGIGLSLPELSSARTMGLSSAGSTSINASASAVDTIFLLPDISNYTRFMTGSQFSFDHAQHIIFTLVNAMIEAATRKVELSKLEGDSALFFADADRCSKCELGETVMDIFRAFFQERSRLQGSNICPCHACRHIDMLDLKIFVHRGQAARFQFRGSVDLFGTDVIVLHRIMKNGVNGYRYVMVTDAAAASIELPDTFDKSVIEEDVQHVGKIQATIYEIDDAAKDELAEIEPTHVRSVVAETMAKLRENLRLSRSANRSIE